MSTDFELFPGKNLSGLFKDIYDNQQNKKQRISELIAEMKKVIRHAGDMAVIGPIIKDLVDTSVKNDDSLIKMAAIAQRMISSQFKSEGDSGFLTDEEKQQLLKDLEATAKEVVSEQDHKVDELTFEVEELKEKLGKK
jgi:CO dehydrogenase/acetyl-CoA synthase alpha subunit